MLRTHLLLTGLIGLFAAGTFVLDHLAEPRTQTSDALDHWARQREAFVARMRDWLLEARNDARPFRAIVADVKGYCEVFYPRYLADLAHAFPEESVEERIGSNLIKEFTLRNNHDELIATPAELAAYHRLRQEMDGWRPTLP